MISDEHPRKGRASSPQGWRALTVSWPSVLVTGGSFYYPRQNSLVCGCVLPRDSYRFSSGPNVSDCSERAMMGCRGLPESSTTRARSQRSVAYSYFPPCAAGRGNESGRANIITLLVEQLMIMASLQPAGSGKAACSTLANGCAWRNSQFS
jgi:hypothetical protein